MRYLLLSFLILTAAYAEPFPPSAYHQLAGTFLRGTKPIVNQELTGIWVGRCVHRRDPNTHWPSFFVMKSLPGFGQPACSVSHLQMPELSNKYDSYTVKDIQSDRLIQTWLKAQSWPKSGYTPWPNGGVSIVNDTPMGNSQIARRFVRRYFDGQHNFVILAYDDSQIPTYPLESFCYYAYKLAAESAIFTPVPMPNPEPEPEPEPQPVGPMVLSTAVNLEAGKVSLKSESGDTVIQKLIISITGDTPVVLSELQIRFPSYVSYLEGKVKLSPGTEKEIDLGEKAGKIRRIDFLLSSRVKNITIRGTP